MSGAFGTWAFGGAGIGPGNYYYDLLGNKTPIINNRVTLTQPPILLQNA
jgi:hypothetical protein